MSTFAPGDLAWIPATSTQARYTIPSELMYGSNRAAWLPVVVKKLEANDQLVGTLEWDTKVDIKCKANLVHPRDSVESCLDLSKLKFHNEGAINFCLGKLYGDMTFSAKIAKYFVNINPGHRLIAEVGHHHNAAADMMPHFAGDPTAPSSIYTAADTAYRKVSEGLLNQTIVMRGCSGSGKTELSKHIVQYLLFAENPSKSPKSADNTTYTPLGHANNPFIDLARSPVSKAVTAGVAVLDIFGGAPSGRNPTSSRVIRQTKLNYDLDGKLNGVNFQYDMFDMSCLDMTRIDKVAPYRIFSLLSLGVPQSDPRSAEYKITSAIMDDLRGLSDSHEEDALADFAYFEELLKAVELPDDTWKDVQCTLAAVLHLQRLNVSGSDTATISAASKNHVAYAEELLRLEKGTLGPTLLKKTMEIGGEKTFKNLSQEDAKHSILALGAILYEKTFKFLLSHCSNFAEPPGYNAVTGPSLRIVDTCGNESLENSPNQMSQFLINVVEEKMNEHYMFRAFEREEQLFRLEGVTPPTTGERIDLRPIAALLDEPPHSIINIIEEVTTMQRGSDKALFDKIFNVHSKGKLIKIAGRNATQTSFVIKHTFGDTQYDLDGFIAANKVAPSSDVKRLINDQLASNFPFLADEDDGADEEKKEDPGDKPRRMTGRASPAVSKINKKNLIANKARTELNNILKSMTGSENDGFADPIYILCLKANNDLQGVHYDPQFISSQIKFFNMSDLSNFCGQGFAKFELFKDFYDRYRLLFSMNFSGLPWKLSSDSDQKSLVKVLLQECAALACEPRLLDDEVLAPVYGSTKIFLRDTFIDILENLRSETLARYSQAATLIQATGRAKKVRNVTKVYKKGFLQLQSVIRRYIQRKIYTNMIRSAKRIQGHFLMKKHSTHFKKMLSAVEVIKRRLLNKMIQRIRYKRLQRATKSLQLLSRGFVVRQHVNHMIRAALVLQAFAADFIKRLRRFYFRKVAVVRIQQVFRGSQCRYENRAAVRVLKKRSNQRTGTKAVLRIQSHWRTKMQCRRVNKVTAAAKCIQGWSISRKKRNEFLKIMCLNKWLQCTARRIIATNKTNELHILRMLEVEAEMLETVRSDEMEALTYHSAANLTDLRIAAGFTKNVSDKFVRYIIGYDVSFDFSCAYPSGWIQTVLNFRKQLTNMGKRRISHIAVGDSHTVIVDSASNIFTFGLGDYGQLGRADRRNAEVPKKVDALKHSAQTGKANFSSMNRSVMENVEIKGLAAGRDHTLALTNSGHIFSWGGNRRGQLGHSNFNSSAIPRLVEGIKNVRIVATGSYHSCCLADPGVVYTWGARECLGRKTDSDECVGRSLPFFSKRRVQHVVSGDSHVVCRSGRNFYSWGSNAFGQLGVADVATKSTVDEVDQDENSDSNSLYSREENKITDEEGGDKLGKIFPTLVKIDSSGWSEKDFFACQLVSGGRHVLMSLYDRLWVWGWNAFGQVGNGTTVNVFAPTPISWKVGEVASSGGRGHQEVKGDANHPSRKLFHIAQMTAGWRNSVIITNGGDIYAWGFAGLHGSFVDPPPAVPEPTTTKTPSTEATFTTTDSTVTEQPTKDVVEVKEPEKNNSSLKKPALVPIDPGIPILSPQRVVLPMRLREQNIVKLYSTHSNAMSLCAIDVLVKDPPKEPLNKSKYVSTRETKPLTVVDSTTSEFTKLQREKLGSWSSSAKMKDKRASIQASLNAKKVEVDNFDEAVEWGCHDVRVSTRDGHKFGGSGAKMSQLQIENERAARAAERERREGKVTHEGLLGLFSPVNTRSTNKTKIRLESDERDFNLFGDESSIASSHDDSTANSASDSESRDQLHIPGFSGGSSQLLLPSANKNNMSLTKMAQQRRSSIAAGRQATPGTWHATDRGVAPRRRASKMMTSSEPTAGQGPRGRRSSVGAIGSSPLSVSKGSSFGAVRSLGQKEAQTLMRSNKESHDMNAKFNQDLASLGNDIHRKREKKKNRFKPTSTSDSINAQVKGLKGGKVRRQDSAGSESGDNGLSLVAVSDLATMIQSIKEESLQNMSASWKF